MDSLTLLDKYCPLLKYHEVISMDLDPKKTEGEVCYICLDPLIGETWRKSYIRKITSCGHAFHSSCIGEWFINHKPTCPFCRNDPTGEISPSQDGSAALDEIRSLRMTLDVLLEALSVMGEVD